ncbi:MAG: N-formylglutamate deformylase [Burkholderiaceae bacterium]
MFDLYPGTCPLLVSLPHVGTRIPHELRSAYVARALRVEDTDWHLDQLYAFVRELGASLIVPRYSRFVIDLNRPPENTPMYAGANNTELCPTRLFSGDALYRIGLTPDAASIDGRRVRYWQPYHDALHSEMTRLQAMHGHAILFDGHSIKSALPWLFEGKLPDLNLGTTSGTSCAPTLRSALQAVLQAQSRFTQVVDGRFKGGYITRSFGRPADGQHAVQLEMCWSTYMQEMPPYAVDSALAAALAPVLRSLVQTMLDWRPDA